MSNEFLGRYPASYTYSDIIDKKRIGKLAYCYMGDRAGSILMVDKDGVRFFPPSDKIGNFGEEMRRHELWAYIDDIKDLTIRRSALNNLYHIYCTYYYALVESGIDLFGSLKI